MFSDSDSDLSDIPVGESLGKQLQTQQRSQGVQEGETKLKYQSSSQEGRKKTVLEIYSDDEEDQMNLLTVPVTKSQRTEKFAASLKTLLHEEDSDDSSDDEPTNTNTSGKPCYSSSVAASTDLYEKYKELLQDEVNTNSSILPSKIVDTSMLTKSKATTSDEFLDKARKARLDLQNISPMSYNLLQSSHNGSTSSTIHTNVQPYVSTASVPVQKDSISAQKNSVQDKKQGETMTTSGKMQGYVQISTCVKGGDPSVQRCYQLKLHDPFSKLIFTYKKEQGYSSLRKIMCEIVAENGMDLNEIDQDKSPYDLGIQSQSHLMLLVHDEQERIKQLRNNPNCTPFFADSTNSSTCRNGGGGALENKQHVMNLGTGSLELQVRINGNDKSIQKYRIQPTEKFQTLMALVCSNYPGLSMNECKFIFEGMALNPNSSPDNEDMEGDEMIDVTIHEAVLMKLNDISSTCDAIAKSQPSLMFENNRKETLNSTESLNGKSVVEVLIIRNNENHDKPRKFKLYSSDTLKKLMNGYKAIFQKKGCHSVQFYLRGIRITEDFLTIESLKLGVKDHIIAMENGRTL